MLETSVGTVIRLGSEAHGGTVAATSAGLLIVGAGSVPRETNEDGTVAAVIVVVLLLQAGSNGVVDLLVVGLVVVHERGGRARGVLEVVVTSTTANDGSTGDVKPERAALLNVLLGRVLAAARLESHARSDTER